MCIIPMGKRNARRLGRRLEIRWLSTIEITAIIAAEAMAAVIQFTGNAGSFSGYGLMLYLTLNVRKLVGDGLNRDPFIPLPALVALMDMV